MTNTESYRVRFRFHLLKPLNIEDVEHTVVVGGRELFLKARTPDLKICDSEWVVVNCRDFDSDEEARSFARKLKSAVELSSVAVRLGVNAGTDQATSKLFQGIKDQILNEHGLIFRDDVHGIDVFSDSPNIRFPFMNAKVTVNANADSFLQGIDRLFECAGDISTTTSNSVMLFNNALSRSMEPIAQVVLAISAVEMIGQQESWTDRQTEILESLADDILAKETISLSEKMEIADAIRRSIHKLSLRQGVMRLLDRLELSHLRKTWDTLYGKRSTLIHGLAPVPGENFSSLANDTISLCGQIVLKMVAREVPEVDQYVDEYYPID